MKLDHLLIRDNLAKSLYVIISTVQSKIAKNSCQMANDAMPVLPLWILAGNNYNYVRLAGFSGLVAFIFSAYDNRRRYNKRKNESKSIFRIGNKFHFFHSAILPVIPLCKQPMITGSLMIVGTIIFSGGCYYRAYTGKTHYIFTAPLGGLCLIMAWLSMML